MAGRAPTFDTSHLTAKENSLLRYFLSHPDEVCEKDDLIRAVWPEDKVFERGVRDDSLAQLVRRLREKIEPDPANPHYIHTVPGRGYRFTRG
jgi:DNA-binding winged helix-turn-helix (wHTH) protein